MTQSNLLKNLKEYLESSDANTILLDLKTYTVNQREQLIDELEKLEFNCNYTPEGLVRAVKAKKEAFENWKERLGYPETPTETVQASPIEEDPLTYLMGKDIKTVVYRESVELPKAVAEKLKQGLTLEELMATTPPKPDMAELMAVIQTAMLKNLPSILLSTGGIEPLINADKCKRLEELGYMVKFQSEQLVTVSGW